MNMCIYGQRCLRAQVMGALLMTAMAWCAPAQAQHTPRAKAGWRGDISRFHEHDWNTWRRGRWIHSSHDGRYGWWWLAGGQWYFYPTPVYPVPNPFEPPLFNGQPKWQPPPALVWYYCDTAATYYPYVANCPEGWKAIPVPVATPLPEVPPVQPAQ